MIDLAAIVSEVRRGMVPAHVYGDPEIFAAERDRLFARSWVFLAHESEIPDPGDYVVRRVLADSFIVARDEAGVVRVMFNMCLHRGMQVCRAELGNASHFRCPYHAWTYRNDGRLAGLPFHREAYGGEDGFPRAGQSLLPAPSMATHNGLIFISLDPDAPAFTGYLGDFAFYLDFYTRQSPAGVELRGPQRWRVKANWKIGAENFAGDSYHTPHTHASVVDIGLFREPKASKRIQGALYQAGPGAGTTYKLPTAENGHRDLADQLRYVGYPDAMIPGMAATWSDRQRALVADSGFMPSAATLFPNLSFVHNWPQIDAADYAGWLELLCEDIRYVMPVRVTTARGAGFDSLAGMGHFDENMYALRKRVQRLATDHAWTEDPPSRTRHFVTNVRTFRAEGEDLRAESALLLFRSRGDTREADLISAGRTDLLRATPDGLRLARREITVDESVLRTQNLAVFLLWRTRSGWPTSSARS